MINHDLENGYKQIVSKFVKNYPDYFTSTRVAKIKKAMRCWKGSKRDGAQGHRREEGDFCSSTVRKNKRVERKAVGGRERNRALWAAEIYKDLREYFNRFRIVEVKFNTSLLVQHAQKFI